MKKLKFTIISIFPPCIVKFGNQNYAIAGSIWQEIPDNYTLDEVLCHWKKPTFKIDKITLKKDYKVYPIRSSKGDRDYEVIYEDGRFKCPCKGFGFRNFCRHVDEAKKLRLKELSN